MPVQDEPPQFIDLIAAFGRGDKASPASKRAGRDTIQVVSHETSEVRFQHAQRLKANHLRPTIARTSVLAALEQAAPRCLDTRQLFRLLRSRFEVLAPATIYRALNDLSGAGLLVRSWGEHGRARYGFKPDGQSISKDTLECHCRARQVFIEDRTLHEHLCSLAGEAGFDIEREPAFTISMVCAGCRKDREDGQELIAEGGHSRAT